MFDIFKSQSLSNAIKELKSELKVKREELKLQDEVNRLKTEITDLKIEKSKVKEGHEKEERELRHMIGLEKKRQEFEIEQAKRETTVEVREANLGADKSRFEENLKFINEVTEKHMNRLESLYTDVIKRIPVVKVNKEL